MSTRERLKVEWPRIFLRIHPKTDDLDSQYVKRILRISGEETNMVENAFTREQDDEILTFDFVNRPALASPDEIRRWPNRAFGNAEVWLSSITSEQVESLRGAGLCVDLCIGNYTGLFPPELLRQILRLGLDFWLFNLGSG